MNIRPRILSILTTRRCPAACEHCCVGAGPRETAAIPVDRIHRLIDEATLVPSIDRIGFTGGECFLLGPQLDELVGHATRCGFGTRVVTNGFWAKDADAARERIATIRAQGLREMVLSTGAFHQRFVAVERVLTAARAAVAAGIATHVSVEACDQADFDAAAVREGLADLVADGRLTIAEAPWVLYAGIGTGAAETAPLTHDRFLAQTDTSTSGGCAQVLTVLSVTPEQQLMACCGFPSEQLPALRIGSIADQPLDALLAHAPDELLKRWLHVGGPNGIAAFVALHVPGYALPPTASICQACALLQRDARVMRVLAEHGADAAPLVDAAFRRFHLGESPSSHLLTPA